MESFSLKKLKSLTVSRRLTMATPPHHATSIAANYQRCSIGRRGRKKERERSEEKVGGGVLHPASDHVSPLLLPPLVVVFFQAVKARLIGRAFEQLFANH